MDQECLTSSEASDSVDGFIASIGCFHLTFGKLEETDALLKFKLEAPVSDNFVAGMRRSHAFQTLCAIDEVLTLYPRTVTEYQEGVTRTIYSLREALHIGNGRLDMFCAIVAACTPEEIPNGRIRPGGVSRLKLSFPTSHGYR